MEAAPWAGSPEALMPLLPHIGASRGSLAEEDAMVYHLIDMIVRQVFTWVVTKIVRSLCAPCAPTVVEAYAVASDLTPLHGAFLLASTVRPSAAVSCSS